MLMNGHATGECNKRRRKTQGKGGEEVASIIEKRFVCIGLTPIASLPPGPVGGGAVTGSIAY